MFKGEKPQGQPRTARSNAEQYADPKNFPEDLPYNTEAGAPLSTPGAAQPYADAAEGTAGQQLSPRDMGPAAFGSVSKPSNSQSPDGGPSPLSNVRRG